MEHLKALCTALGMSLDEATGTAPLEAKTAVEQRMLSLLRDLDTLGAEALLATGEAILSAKRGKL